MEELQVIETTSGRQFKPWATKDDVQDPASVTAIASEIASGKQAIAAAINAKGGTADPLESFQQLAQDIEDMSQTLINQGMETIEPINVLMWVCDFPTQRDFLKNIDDNVVEHINLSPAFQDCHVLSTVRMSNVKSISAGGIFQGCSSLITVTMDTLNTISGQASFFNCSSLEYFIGPNLATISNSMTFRGCTKLKAVYLGTLITLFDPLYDNKLNLRNITIGQDTNVNLPFQQWTATNVIAEGQSGIDELNTNLQINLISKLYQGGGKILRLGAALYDVTTQETRDMVTAKGWTLQRG